MTEFVPELIVGFVLLIFGAAFRHWASTVKESSQRILERLERLYGEFHDYRINIEKRMTKLETKADVMCRDRNNGSRK